MTTSLSLRNYKEWKHCITQLCRIPLTLPYVEASLTALQDPRDYTTQRFVENWGEAHRLRVSEWFRIARAELKANGI